MTLSLKPIKDDSDYKKPSRLYMWWLESKVSDYYYRITWKLIGKPLQDIKKMWDWYWNVFRYDVDFDGHSIFAIIEYKLKRIQKSLSNGTAWQDPKDLNALRLAIKISERIRKNEYCIKAYKKCKNKPAEQRLKDYDLADIKAKREQRWLYGILCDYLRNWWD